ncbi:MAG: TIGR03621 family F420-dependent LLM class oxidoreductase [Candidatus Limnocylindria bacterium]
MHEFRFAVHSRGTGSAEDWTRVARRAEELGYHALYMPDHLRWQLSPVAALAAAAAVTRTLRIGAYVFANDFRHPLMLVREAATLDVLSGGRFEFGLGAGWLQSDYQQLGLPYDRPGLRIERMAEALGIIKRLLTGERVDHQGRHYRLDGARLAPMPVQSPHPPIMLGGGGPRFLRLAAREADIVGFVPRLPGRPAITDATEAALARKVAIVREAAGERFERLELNVFVGDAGVIGLSRPVDAAVAALKSVVPALVGGSPYLLYGTLGELRERLLRRREVLGISSYGIPEPAMEALAPLVAALAGR